MINDIAARLMSSLMRDYGLTREQAAGFVGNLAQESGGFKSLQEIKPVVPGSRGGYGYAQWTGPRRKQFEAWSQQNNLDPSSYEANYGFLRHELDNTPEGRVLGPLRQAPDVATAAKVVEQGYLRPGIPHSESRVRWAQRVLGGEMPTQTAAAPQAVAQAAPTTDAPSSVAEIMGTAKPKSPMAILAMLGEQPAQQQQAPDPRQSFAPFYAWARQNGWSA